MHGRGGAGEVVDLVDFDEDGIDDVVAYELEVGVADPVREVGFGAGEEVVERDHVVAHEHEAVDEVGADESCAAGDEDAAFVEGVEAPDCGEGGGVRGMGYGGVAASAEAKGWEVEGAQRRDGEVARAGAGDFFGEPVEDMWFGGDGGGGRGGHGVCWLRKDWGGGGVFEVGAAVSCDGLCAGRPAAAACSVIAGATRQGPERGPWQICRNTREHSSYVKATVHGSRRK